MAHELAQLGLRVAPLVRHPVAGRRRAVPELRLAAAAAHLGEERVPAHLEAPALVVGEVELQHVDAVRGEQVDEPEQLGHRPEPTGDVEHHAAPREPGLAVEPEGRASGGGHAPAASSRARASAASVARSKTSFRSRLLEHRDGALGGALGARHASAQLGGVDVGCREQLARAPERALHHERRLLGREPLVDGRRRELLDEVEDVGRAGARDRGQRVDLLLGHDDHVADGLEQRRRRARGRRRSSGCPRETPVTARPTTAGVFGIERMTATDSGSSDSNVATVTPAATRHDDRAGLERVGDLAQQVGHHRGLDGDDHELARPRPPCGSPRHPSRSRTT